MPAEVGLPWPGFAPAGAAALQGHGELVTAEPQGAASLGHAGGSSKSGLRIWRRNDPFCQVNFFPHKISAGKTSHGGKQQWVFVCSLAQEYGGLKSLNYCWFSDVPMDVMRGTTWHGMGWHGTAWNSMEQHGTPGDGVGHQAGRYRSRPPTMGFVLQS